jgi:hypothetical protein
VAWGGLWGVGRGGSTSTGGGGVLATQGHMSWGFGQWADDGPQQQSASENRAVAKLVR